MKTVDELTFPNGHQAKVLRIRRGFNLHQALDQLDLQHPIPTLVLVGGAKGISAEAMIQLRSLFCEVIAPLAEGMGLAVVDGGTDAGVMQLMGQARHQIRGAFPLVGVAVKATVILPDLPPAEDAAPLEPHHSHFALVPGAIWGDEAPWIAKFASALAGSCPSLTVLVNGGEISWQDVDNSLREKRPVLVIGGSGRTADDLAAAILGDRTNERANRMIETGLLQTVDLFTEPDTLRKVFEALLNPVLSKQLKTPFLGKEVRRSRTSLPKNGVFNCLLSS